MSIRRTGSPWAPTVAHVRAGTIAVVLAVGAVVARRPDLLVLAAPFGVVALWATVARPDRAPSWHEQLGQVTIREGAATRWRATMTTTVGDDADDGDGADDGDDADDGDGADDDARDRDGGGTPDIVVAEMAAGRWIVRRPTAGAVAVDARRGRPPPEIAIRSTRWGRARLGQFRVTAVSAWGGFRSVGPPTSHVLTTLPVPGPFDSIVPFRPSHGLVGPDRSAHTGDGGEFAALRAFRPGDRVRRINWPRSLRTGELRVDATWADQDSHVALLLDASTDIGPPGDVDGPGSSLDTGVRAAGAIAEHLVRRGDRVSLQVYGGSLVRFVPPGTGRRHARRVLDSLTEVRLADGRRTSAKGSMSQPGLAAASLVVMLSPLVTHGALARAVALGRRGMTVVVIDTLPEQVATTGDRATELAWRVRLLERRREIGRIERVGVPVVRWRGPGSLDEFLRGVAHRARAPRMRAR